MMIVTPQLLKLYETLGIHSDHPRKNNLPIFDEGTDLVWVDGCDGPYQMNKTAAGYWEAMRCAAETDGIEIFLVSAFRSHVYQAGLIQKKLAAGDVIGDILKVVAPPGCSQHHTGKAIDLGTPGSEFLEEDFETTDAFTWLQKHATRYNFTMPFTQNNPHGFIYEPWHWYFEN